MRTNPSEDDLVAGGETCWVVSNQDGRILQAGGNVRRFLNVSDRSIIGRDIYTFIERERERCHISMLALAPNMTIALDLMIRPRDRKPMLVGAVITRQADDSSFLWHFTPVGEFV